MSAENPTVEKQERKPLRFKTAKGSVYEYLPDGRTRRFKAVENDMKEPNDSIVFIPPWDLIKDDVMKNYPQIFEGIENEVMFSQLLLEYAQKSEHTIRITDSQGSELNSNQEIKAADRAFILCLDKNNIQNSFYIPVSKEPKIGYLTFDTTKYIKDGETYRNRHIGNVVTEIEYQA